MRTFNIVFLVVNLVLLAGAVYLYWASAARERRHFELLKPVLLRVYKDFNMKLPTKEPQNLDELVAPLEAITEGLSK